MAFGQNSPQFDQRSISEDFVLRLVQITTRLRSVGIADAKMINELFAESGDTPFDYALPEGVDDVESVLWSHFFRNTQIYYSHLKSPNPLVAYYDPFSDFFLLTIWDNSSRNPMLVQAGIYPSEVFMDGKSATKLELVPGWLKEIRTKPFLKVLPVMAGKAIRSFEKRYPLQQSSRAVLPDQATASRPREVFRNRLSFLFSTLLELQADEKLSSAYLKTVDAVQSGNPLAIRKLFNGPTTMPVNDVASFPEAFRKDLEPVLFLKGQDGGLIVSSRKENGRWLLVSAFSDGPDSSLTAIGYLDPYAEGGQK